MKYCQNIKKKKFLSIAYNEDLDHSMQMFHVFTYKVSSVAT